MCWFSVTELANANVVGTKQGDGVCPSRPSSPTVSRPHSAGPRTHGSGCAQQQFGRSVCAGYSSLSALTGFTPAARRAGRYAATQLINSTPATAPA